MPPETADREGRSASAHNRRCSVRSAQPGDAEQVATLLEELGYPDNQVTDVRQRLSSWASETTSRALVAERDEQVLGIVAVTAILYLEHDGRWGRIVALVVSSACRGQGIGRQLVQAAEEAASELGCVVMEVTSARSRAESHPFYQNLAYQDWGDRSVRYLKDLVPGASMASYGSRFPARPQSPDS